MTVREVIPVSDTAITDGGATETVVVTSTAVSTASDGQRIVLMGHVNVTAGTGATAIVVKVRRGTDITGTVVGSAETDTLAAGNSESIPFDVIDTPGDVSGQKYVVTLTETGASAAGTANYAYIGGFIS